MFSLFVFTALALFSVSSCQNTPLTDENVAENLTPVDSAPLLLDPPLPLETPLSDASAPLAPQKVNRNSAYALPPGLTSLPDSKQLRNSQSVPNPTEEAASDSISPPSHTNEEN